MNVNDLTMREMRDLQKALGLPGDRLQEDAFGLAAGMAWLIKRREDESFTFDQALDLTQAEVNSMLGDEDPKD